MYAGLQVPIGVLLDRFGSRVLLLGGLVLMTVGQLAFAFASSFPLAVLARALVGAGDAAIFVSVIRLVTLWFLVRQAPLITQLTGQLGQLGAIAAAAPLSLALSHLGWTKSFALASSLGVVGMVAVALLVKDSPYAREGVARIKMRALARTLRLVWGNPGTRLGMWSHFTSQFSATVFTLLWGFPFLVRGEGLSSGHGQRPADGDDRLDPRQRTGARDDGVALPVLPLVDGARDRRRDGPDVGRRPGSGRPPRRCGCSSCWSA